MGPTKRVEIANTVSHRPTEIGKEEYEIRDSEYLEFVENNDGRDRREIRLKWKPLHNLQSTPNDQSLVRALKKGVRKFQFAGHWAIEVGKYTWELWQDQNTHKIGLGEDNKGPVRWINLQVIRQSDGEVVKTEETLKKIKSKRCGWTTKSDTEIRNQAISIIDDLQNKRTALSTRDRVLQWQFNMHFQIMGKIFGKKVQNRIKELYQKEADIRSSFVRAIRGGNNSDEQYRYDIFFRNCHTFAERLAKQITASHYKTKLFFLTRYNAKDILYNQMTQGSMSSTLQNNLIQQQLMINQQLMLNQQTILQNL